MFSRLRSVPPNSYAFHWQLQMYINMDKEPLEEVKNSMNLTPLEEANVNRIKDAVGELGGTPEPMKKFQASPESHKDQLAKTQVYKDPLLKSMRKPI